MAEYTRALVLTTPHIKGQKVKDAQYLMKGNNVFGPKLACYKDQPIDGDYGPVTAQAAARTKYWLGYKQSLCTPTFGQTLYDLLTGKLALTPANKRLRTQRLAYVPIGQKALQIAIGQIGYKEEPLRNVNDNKYGRWYGLNWEPWCAIFESWSFSEAGYDRFRYAAVEQIYYDALAGRNNLRLVWSPQPGDLLCYAFGGDTFAHTAFFDGWVNQAAGTFYDVGGNTGSINMSNGGEVLRQIQNRGIVHGIVRVG